MERLGSKGLLFLHVLVSEDFCGGKHVSRFALRRDTSGNLLCAVSTVLMEYSPEVSQLMIHHFLVSDSSSPL